MIALVDNLMKKVKLSLNTLLCTLLLLIDLSISQKIEHHPLSRRCLEYTYFPGVGCTKAADSAIHWIAIFFQPSVVKLAVDRYNLRLIFGIYKLKFLRSIVGSRSVVCQKRLIRYLIYLFIFSSWYVEILQRLLFTVFRNLITSVA